MRQEPTAAERQSAFRRYGFTDDAAHLQRVRAFAAAALADGWTVAEAGGGDRDDIRSRMRLERDGYVLRVVARDNGALGISSRYAYEASMAAWGPDGLQIRLPEAYSMAAIEAALNVCNVCDRAADRTYRYSFAGRCCAACLPRARAEFERPGWTR